MGLLFSNSGSPQASLDNETRLLNQLGCKACPLAGEPGRMEPTGSAEPVVYMLGEAPGRNEIDDGRQFIGPSGQLLRGYIPRDWRGRLRWNNCVRSRPPRNRNPERTELECCRPSVVADIELAKPKAIFGFGNVPLTWISGFSGITYWRGRRMPVRVGTHTCWYYAFLHPSYLLREQRRDRRTGAVLPSEDERMTRLDLERAFRDLDRLPEPVVHDATIALANVGLLTDYQKIESALRWASRLPHVGVDYETNALRPYSDGAKVLTVGVGNSEHAFAFPLDHPGARFTARQRADIADLWTRFLERAPCEKVVHNLSFEMEWSAVNFSNHVLRAGRWQDTATAAAILDERVGKTKPGCFSLEFLVQAYFGFNLKKLSNVDRKNLESTPLQAVLRYNASDARYHDTLWEALWAAIVSEGLEDAYQLALRRVPTAVLSQVKGIPIDQPTVSELSGKYAKKVAGILTRISDLPVVKEFERQRLRAFNPNSQPDVLVVFDEMLGFDAVNVVDKYSKKEKKSVDDSVLSQIDHPLAPLLQELRTASGTKSKYIDSLLIGSESCVLFPDGLSHTNFNTYFARTGRMSSDDPNWQNFPKRDAETKEVRRSVRAGPGQLVLSFDYGQIEARVIAMFTKDKVFCKALWERYDVHMDWAERIARAYPERIGGRKNLTDKKVMKTFRTDIKNQWTFPLFFGARDTSVAGYLNIPIDVVKPLVRDFWKEFSGVRAWQERQQAFYNENGYVECLTGRRRRGPLSVNQVMNSPVQGTAAEIVMDAMCRLSEIGDLELQPEINIHDDLTFVRVDEARVDAVAERVITEMLRVPFEWAKIVPITVEMSLGKDWASSEEIGSYSSDDWNV